MLVAVLIPLILLIATVLLERFESRMLDLPTRRRTVRPPLRLEAAKPQTVAQRHLAAVPEPLVVDVVPAEVSDKPLPKAS